MALHGSTVLKRITLSQLTGLLQQLGFRAKVISPALIESASNGWVWQIELWPPEEAETLVFKAEMFVAHDVIADINKFLQANPLCVPTYKKLDDGTTEVQIRAVHSLFGGVTVDHVSSWIEHWVSSLTWATEDLMYL
jgi:hypothetical protein